MPTIWLNLFLNMPENFFIRNYRPEDFDALTILWRISREKSLPEFQNKKGHFFYEDQNYFRDHILKENTVFVVESGQRPVAFMAIKDEFVDQLYVHPDYQNQETTNYKCLSLLNLLFVVLQFAFIYLFGGEWWRLRSY